MFCTSRVSTRTFSTCIRFVAYFVLTHRVGRAKLFLWSSELALLSPHPLTRRRVGGGGGGTLACGGGSGGVPIPTRGHTLWYSMYGYIFALFFLPLQYIKFGNDNIVRSDIDIQVFLKVAFPKIVIHENGDIVF
jgi:hypothetical protein